jgi:hypothetical protein
MNLENIQFETHEEFECLLIKKGDISHISWMDNDYCNKLMTLDLFTSILVNEENFIKNITTNLEIEKYNLKNVIIKTEIVGEDQYYLYELIYIELQNDDEYNQEKDINELGSLININNEKIYSNAILLKTHFPPLTNSIILTTVTKKDLELLLYHRVNTKLVIWNDVWKEENIKGDLNIYAQEFFDGDDYEKIEISFLMHNINIWYTSIDGFEKDVCGKLINKPIEKCILFTMKSEEYRGNITLDEIKKIIYLSNVLTSYDTPNKFSKDETDYLGRKIIYNKYKVLDIMYHENK